MQVNWRSMFCRFSSQVYGARAWFVSHTQVDSLILFDGLGYGLCKHGMDYGLWICIYRSFNNMSFIVTSSSVVILYGVDHFAPVLCCMQQQKCMHPLLPWAGETR